MEMHIPSPAEVRAQLERLSHAQMQELSRLSGVPFTTLWKVRGGETANPGIDTVRKFMPHVEAAAKAVEEMPKGRPIGSRAEPAAEEQGAKPITRFAEPADSPSAGDIRRACSLALPEPSFYSPGPSYFGGRRAGSERRERPEDRTGRRVEVRRRTERAS